MNKDFARGLAVGLILVGINGGIAEYVVRKQEAKIKRYKKIMKILINVADGLEQHVDSVTVRAIMDANEFDVMMLHEFGE